MDVLQNQFVDPLENNLNGEGDHNSADSEEGDGSEVFFVCRAIDEEFLTNSVDSNLQELIIPKLPPGLAHLLANKQKKVQSNPDFGLAKTQV